MLRPVAAPCLAPARGRRRRSSRIKGGFVPIHNLDEITTADDAVDYGFDAAATTSQHDVAGRNAGILVLCGCFLLGCL